MYYNIAYTIMKMNIWSGEFDSKFNRILNIFAKRLNINSRYLRSGKIKGKLGDG